MVGHLVTEDDEYALVGGQSKPVSAAFTPGPWKANKAWTAHPRFGIFGSPTVVIGKAWTEEDARLIAAAPELYGCLARLLHELEWVNEQLDLMPDDYADALTFAQAALAKARGEQ